MAHHEEHEQHGFFHLLFQFELLQMLLRPQVLIVAATVFLYASTLWRQRPEQLTGEVYDRDNRLPVAGVGVSLLDHSGQLLKQAVTDEAGVFIFSIMGKTDYQLKLEKPGYEPRLVDDSASMNNSPSVILRIPVHRAR